MSRFDAATVDQLITEDIGLLSLPRGVRLVYIEALVWARAHRTDGAFPRGALRRFTDEPDTEAAAEALVEVGAWAETEAGWTIKDYARLQLSKEAVEREQAATSARWDRYRVNPTARATGASRAARGAASEPRADAPSDNGASPRRAETGHTDVSEEGRKQTFRPNDRATDTDARSARAVDGPRSAPPPAERTWQPWPSRMAQVGEDPGKPPPPAGLAAQLRYATWPLRVTVGEIPEELQDDFKSACQRLGADRLRQGIEQSLSILTLDRNRVRTTDELLELALECAADAGVPSPA